VIHWLIHFLGIDTQQSDNYDFVSGVGPMLVTIMFGSGAIIAFCRRHNCHQHHCWRLARHQAGAYLVCRRHHPDPAVREGLRPHHIAASHQERR
jgi:hypothetical protein